MRPRTVIITVLVALALVLLTGCVTGSAGADSVVTETVRDPRTGEQVFHRETRTGMHSTLPPSPAGPTTMSTDGAGGISIELPRAQEQPLSTYGLAQRQWIFYGGGAIVLVGAAVAVWAQQRVFAACLSAAAMILFFAPKWIDVYSRPVGLALGLVLLVGAAWFVANVYRNARENRSAIQSWFKLQREGEPEAAGAALREAPIVRKVTT